MEILPNIFEKCGQHKSICILANSALADAFILFRWPFLPALSYHLKNTGTTPTGTQLLLYDGIFLSVVANMPAFQPDSSYSYKLHVEILVL